MAGDARHLQQDSLTTRDDNKAVRSRVLRWLHHDSSSSTVPVTGHPTPDCVAEVYVGSPSRLDQICNLQTAPLRPIGHVSNATAATRAGSQTPRQRVAQLWKKWKSRALNSTPDNASSSGGSKGLSPAVLQRHQQLFGLQSMSSIGAAAELGCDATSVLAAAAAGPLWGATRGGQPHPPTAQHCVLKPPMAVHSNPTAPQAAGGAGPQSAAAPQCERLARVYDSPLYQPSSSGPSKASSPQAPGPGSTAAAMLPPLPRAAAGIPSPLRTTTSCGSAGASFVETSSPSVTPRRVSGLRCSSSFNKTNGSEASQQGTHAALPDLQGSRELDICLQQLQLRQQDVSGGADRPCVKLQIDTASSGPISARSPLHQPQYSPLQHSPLVFAKARNEQLLQAPTQPQPLQQLQPAPATGHQLLPPGSALTAYPAVAAALSTAAAGAGGMLPGRWGRSTAAGQAFGPAGASTSSAGWPAHTAQALSGELLSMESPFAAAAAAEQATSSTAAAAVQHSTPPAGPAAGAEASTSDVQDWLLRTALLEDELQGRALEVAEELQQLQERHELFVSLAASLQCSTAGSATHEAAASAAADSLGAARGSRGALYPPGSMRNSPGIRSQVCAEVSLLEASTTKLQERAAGLGSALATLQGCQAVLASSKAARLSPGSRLAVLQLVLSDVVARLPGEGLQELEVLQGLPSLDAAGREICVLAGSSSLAASVQPLLQVAQQQQLMQPPTEVLASTPQQPFSTAAAASVEAASAAAVRPAATPQVPQVGPHMQGPDAGTDAYPDSHRHRQHNSNSSSSALLHSTSAPNLQVLQRLRLPQQQLLQERHSEAQRAPWYADLHGGAEESEDDILDSLSSVLSSRYYTPRPSLSYESRKAAAAAARQAALAAQHKPQATVTPGSAAAAGAAALTLAGIASSGSWANPQGAEEIGGGVDSSSYTGLWDMVCVHSPRSTSSLQHKWQQPQSPSSAASSRRGAGSSRMAGFGPSGLPFPLPSWPESPTAVAAGGDDAQRSPFAQPTGAAQASTGGDAVTSHAAVLDFLQSAEAARQQQPAHTELTRPAGAGAGAGAGAAASMAADAQTCTGPLCSRSSSFESCFTAMSRWSCDTSSQAGPQAAAASLNPGATHTTAAQGYSNALSAGILQQYTPARCTAADSTPLTPAAAARVELPPLPPLPAPPAPAAVVSASPPSHLGCNVADAPLSAALPPGTDLNRLTVGELLQALTAVVGQQQPQQGQQSHTEAGC